MIFTYVLLALISFLLVFVVFPSIVLFFVIFSKKKNVYIENYKFKGTYIEPYEELMKNEAAKLRENDSSEVKITAYDGAVLTGQYFDKGFKRTAVFFHGFCSDPFTNFSAQANDLIENGFNILFVHQRGHVGSGGRFAGLGLLEQNDVLSWTAFVKNDLGAEEILIYGTSMGCAAVSYASSKIDEPAVKMLILDCGFTSPWDQMIFGSSQKKIKVAQLAMPLIRLWAKLIVGVDIKKKVTESLGKNRIPSVFIHGEADSTVSAAQGLANYESCASEKTKIFVPGAEHAISYVTDREHVKGLILEKIKIYFERD